MLKLFAVYFLPWAAAKSYTVGLSIEKQDQKKPCERHASAQNVVFCFHFTLKSMTEEPRVTTHHT